MQLQAHTLQEFKFELKNIFPRDLQFRTKYSTLSHMFISTFGFIFNWFEMSKAERIAPFTALHVTTHVQCVVL